VIPSLVGLSQLLFAGSPRKNCTPAISKLDTDPRLYKTFAPRVLLYHSTAVSVSASSRG
jgi:hypothetical protein